MCCITNNPKAQWFKVRSIYFSLTECGSAEPGWDPLALAWLQAVGWVQTCSMCVLIMGPAATCAIFSSRQMAKARSKPNHTSILKASVCFMFPNILLSRTSQTRPKVSGAERYILLSCNPSKEDL